MIIKYRLPSGQKLHGCDIQEIYERAEKKGLIRKDGHRFIITIKGKTKAYRWKKFSSWAPSWYIAKKVPVI
jgi:hypothetical protein